MVDHAADCARRHPEWALGGAYVAGLAIARFLKASRPDGAAYGSYRHDIGIAGSGTTGTASRERPRGAVDAVPVTDRLPEVH